MSAESRDSSVRVLVTGGEHAGGLAALRALRLGGYEPWAALVDMDVPAARSTAVAGKIEIPDPRNGTVAFATALAEIAEELGAAVVLPGTEPCLLALSDEAGAFPDSVALGVCPPEAVRRATDKLELAGLAAAAGMEVPPTEQAQTGDGPPGGRFPAVLKPLRSELIDSEGQLKRFECRRVDDAGELNGALADLPGETGLLQPFFEGGIRTSNGLAWEGEIVAANQQIAHRIWPRHCGALCYAETVPTDPKLHAAVGRLMDQLNWSGIFNVQLVEEGGRLHLIDLNPRFYHSMALATASGLNLPSLWVSRLLGRDTPRPGYRTGVRFRSEPEDLRALAAEFRGGARLAALRGLAPRRHTAHALMSRSDPRPALWELAGFARSAPGRARRRMAA